MSDLVTRTVLKLSTLHLRSEICAALNTYGAVIADHTRAGWLMLAEDNAAELAEQHHWPTELLPIVAMARLYDCAYILFDRDAATTAMFPTFPWLEARR
jgi:hypothetical protein